MDDAGIERARIVAWLRAEASRDVPTDRDGRTMPDWRCPWPPSGEHAVGIGPGLMLALAGMIEQCQHLEPPTPTVDP